MKPIKTLFNGKIIKPKTAKVSIYSPTVQWGYGVFTTLRTYDGIVFEIDKHIERLVQNASFLKLDIPDTNTLKHWINKIAKHTNLPNQRIKISILQEGVYIHSYELKIDQKIYTNGVSCLSTSSTRAYPEIKKTSYLDSIIPHQEAVKNNYFDAILVDQEGFVTEGAFCNIFWFEGDVLCTRNDSVLNGITKQVIEKTTPFQLEYKKIKIEDLKAQEEVFLTQTTSGIVPIIEIDKTLINGGKIGKNTAKLINLFEQYAQAQT